MNCNFVLSSLMFVDASEQDENYSREENNDVTEELRVNQSILFADPLR